MRTGTNGIPKRRVAAFESNNVTRVDDKYEEQLNYLSESEDRFKHKQQLVFLRWKLGTRYEGVFHPIEQRDGENVSSSYVFGHEPTDDDHEGVVVDVENSHFVFSSGRKRLCLGGRLSSGGSRGRIDEPTSKDLVLLSSPRVDKAKKNFSSL